MDEISTLSHVDLLDRYADSVYRDSESLSLKAEVLRRMDSARTSQRQDIAPDPEGTQR